MRKNMIMKFWLLLIVILWVGVFASCEKEDEGTPVVYSVRLTDPAKADSTFTEANRGTLILIQGENLGGVIKVFINDQEVGFNTSYNTSTSLLVTIPAELKLVAEDSSLKHEIRLETGHGVATYSFRILAPSPSISYYKADWHVDEDGNKSIIPGQDLSLFGSNFYDVERIYMTDVDPEVESSGQPIIYDIEDYTVESDFSKIVLKMPEVVLQKAYFVVECYSGTASLPFRAYPIEPAITDITSDMPIPGERVTIYGKNFIDVRSVKIGDDEIVIPVSQLTVSESQDEITFVLPTAPQNSDKLYVVTDGGQAVIDFYKRNWLIADFDTTNGWFSWGGYHVTQADGQYVPTNLSGNCHGLEGVPGAWNFWWGQMVFGGFEMPTSISANTPISQIELRFECYAGAPFDGISTKMYLSDNESKCLDGIQFVDRNSETVEVGHWMTCAYPLSSFTDKATYGDYDFNGNMNIFVINPTDNGQTRVVMYVDNFRLYVKESNDN